MRRRIRGILGYLDSLVSGTLVKRKELLNKIQVCPFDAHVHVSWTEALDVLSLSRYRSHLSC